MTITLLDGGMGQELVARSGDAPTPLWSTQVMMDHPGLARDLHRDYFAAGAVIATANTYALHHDRLVKFRLDHRFHGLYDQALAEAREACPPGGRVAGSMGPLVASYRPETLPPMETAIALYTEVAALMADRVDLLIAETVASLDHARAVIAGARAGAPGKALWLAVTVDDEDGTRLRSGEPVAGLAGLADQVDAVLANCSAPEAMDQAMPVLAGLGRPFGAYANAFEQITKDFLKDNPTVDALSKRPEMTPARYAECVLGWVRSGATIVGGCCETTPAHIAAVRDRLVAQGYMAG
jgi:S-methylmethionine-dependent homocysteine/selenocysteine methylase